LIGTISIISKDPDKPRELPLPISKPKSRKNPVSVNFYLLKYKIDIRFKSEESNEKPASDPEKPEFRSLPV
jgi:hypothetical protein